MQDWYRGLVIAKALLQKYPGGKMLLLTATQIEGEQSELDNYLAASKELQVSPEKILALSQANETIEQIEIASKLAKENGADLLIVSTFLHYFRVRWLCRGLNAKHYVAWGIPRPREAISDSVLTVLFPLIDICGGRKWFLNMAQNRRKQGKL